MPTKQIKVGDRIRLKVRLMGGWKGTGTVIFSDPYGGIIEFLKDGDSLDEWGRTGCFVCKHEVAVMRKQAVLS